MFALKANSTDGKMADIVFDLNGPKAPNESGKDIYNFVVYLDYESESSYIAPKDFLKYMTLNDSSTGQPLSQNRLLDTIKTTKKTVAIIIILQGIRGIVL